MKKITIEVTEEQHKEILGIIKPKGVKPWRAEVGGTYWYISSPKIVQDFDDKRMADDYRYLTGNYYQTQEEAQQALERQKAIGRVTHRIIELNDGWEPDWSDGNQAKYSIGYSYHYERFYYDYNYTADIQFTLPYTASKKIADQIIAEMKDDLKLIWGL